MTFVRGVQLAVLQSTGLSKRIEVATSLKLKTRCRHFERRMHEPSAEGTRGRSALEGVPPLFGGGTVSVP